MGAINLHSVIRSSHFDFLFPGVQESPHPDIRTQVSDQNAWRDGISGVFVT
jgi:hypothetical protein